MPASNCQILLSRVALAVAIACTGWCGMPTGDANAEISFPTSRAYHRRSYDPFEEPAPVAATVEPAVQVQPASQAEPVVQIQVEPVVAAGVVPATPPASVTIPKVPLRRDFQLSAAAFERLPTPTVRYEVKASAYQVSAPVPPESLPAPPASPPARYESASDAEEPGANWTPKPLGELSTNIVLPSGVLPRDHWSERPPQHMAFFDPCGSTRGWPVNSFNWVASCFYSNPLYFEEINLERYGYGCGCVGPCCSTCLQSAVSAAHFFVTVPMLPYEMAVDCPGECDYTLGHYRPGSCPPWRYHCCTRCSALGGLSAGAVATGIIFLIP